MNLSIEQEILLFIWKWKMVSSSALYMRFFSHLRPISAYMRIERLKMMKLIITHCDQVGRIALWTLTKKGFDSIKDLLPELDEEGWQSEAFIHDYWVTAVHLGEFLADKVGGPIMFSEQELRRYQPEHYPLWVPSTRMHRPDGYWMIEESNNQKAVDNIEAGNEKSVIALEVELSRKPKESYQMTFEFYRQFTHIKWVIWVVDSQSQALNLHRHFNEWGGATAHQFMTVSSFAEHGWDAPIIIGSHKGSCLNKILIKDAEKTDKRFYYRALLDGKRCPKNPLDSEAPDVADVAIGPV